MFYWERDIKVNALEEANQSAHYIHLATNTNHIIIILNMLLFFLFDQLEWTYLIMQYFVKYSMGVMSLEKKKYNAFKKYFFWT